jgi:hypothetical protein
MKRNTKNMCFRHKAREVLSKTMLLVDTLNLKVMINLISTKETKPIMLITLKL